MKSKNGGFTLVELLATLASTTIVTLAAMSFLVVCFRMCASAEETSQEQDTSRIVLTLMGQIARDGTLKEIKTFNNGSNKTQLLLGGEVSAPAPGAAGGGSTNTVLLCYSAETKTLYTGGTYTGSDYNGGSVLMENVESFDAKFDPDNKLLTVTLTIKDKPYTTSVYCRTNDIQQNQQNPAEPSSIFSQGAEPFSIFSQGMVASYIDKARDTGPEHPIDFPDLSNEEWLSRFSFIANLNLQYGSDGKILTGEDKGKYFSEWYIGGYGGENKGWNKDTAWCACYVSWGIAQVREHLKTVPCFANVGDGITNFKNGSYGTWLESGVTPLPGDLVFFEWEDDDDTLADHVGVVWKVQDGRVYTLEGNSNDKVAVRSYKLDDSCILGYGQLKWINDTPLEFGNN